MEIRFILTVITMTFLCVDDTMATDTPTLPVSLPIGNRQAMLDSAVTNNYTWYYEFFSYREPGNNNLYGAFSSGFRPFPSYDVFRTFVITNALEQKKLIDDFEPEYQPSSQAQATLLVLIYFTQTLEYWSATERNILVIEKKLGAYHNFTTNDLTDIEPYYIHGVSWVTNLQQFTAEVQTPTGLYQNQWNASTREWTNTTGKDLIEIVGNAVIFDGRYISPTNRARFIPQIGAVKGTYTQDGARITPSSLQIKSNQLNLSMSKGSDTTIESSLDNENWVDEVTIPWSLHTNRTTVPIDTSAPLKFFRARSR